MHQARQARLKALASAGVVGLLTFSTITATLVVLAPSATAADSSTVTVTAADQDPDLAGAPFPDLSVTVSQTRDLVAQGIRLDYSGGVKSSTPGGGEAGKNFLQAFQCWDDLRDANGNLVLDDDGNPQPDRTTCQWGDAGSGESRESTYEVEKNNVAAEDEQYTRFGTSRLDPTMVSVPFRAVNGKILQRIWGGEYISSVDPNNNEFFTRYTTNQVPWIGFSASGAGTVTFEVQTGAQAPGLGCGSALTSADGTVTGRPCWLVVVPRGTADPGEESVTKSPLVADVWKHRLAVRLDFKPMGVRCAAGAAEKSLAGSELLAGAVGSWQPKLCGSAGGSIFNLIVAAESDQVRAANGTDTEALALTTRALAEPDVADKLTYAPVGVSGLTVAFSIDHQTDGVRDDVPASVAALEKQPFTSMNLTPRLLAKLLTNSYKGSHHASADTSHLRSNPDYLWKDPDFLAVNDVAWKYQSLAFPGKLADVLVPLGRSDSAWVVWQYVLSDPEAVAFLSGTPDKWGMVVNPYSSTTALANPTGVAATYPKDSFPKADPTAYTPEGKGEINLVTYRPYASDLDQAGYWVLRGDARSLDQASWDADLGLPQAFRKYGTQSRDRAGWQKVVGLTDTASAAKYQVFTAALRNPAGKFVTPTPASMAAAAAVMTPVAGQAQVRALDYASADVKAAEGAYPLTVPIYAATNAAGGDAATRKAYASFIRYAAGPGQVSGTDDGQLPPGYAPLPAAWAADAKKAADTIAAGPQATPTPTPSATPSTATPTTNDIPVTRAPGTADVPSSAPSDAGQVPATGGGAIPVPTGGSAGPVVGVVTPEDPDIAALRAAVPVGAVGGLLAALCVPLVPRIRRGA